MKLGQLVASSPSVFPAEYVEEFQACLDKSSTVSPSLDCVFSKLFGDMCTLGGYTLALPRFYLHVACKIITLLRGVSYDACAFARCARVNIKVYTTIMYHNTHAGALQRRAAGGGSRLGRAPVVAVP